MILAIVLIVVGLIAITGGVLVLASSRKRRMGGPMPARLLDDLDVQPLTSMERCQVQFLEVVLLLPPADAGGERRRFAWRRHP